MKNLSHPHIKIIIGCVIALVLILVLYVIIKPFLLLYFQVEEEGIPQDKVLGVIDKVRIGVTSMPSNALMDIAKEKKFFEEMNLDVEFYKYNEAKNVFDNMLVGIQDVSFIDQSPVIEASFIRNDFKIIASTIRSNTTKIIARKDKGILAQNDLKGKKLNVKMGTSSEYFVDMFLEKYQISNEEIILTDFPLPAAVMMLLNGEIDAMVVPDPNVLEIMNVLGDAAILFYEPEMYSYSTLLTARDDYLIKNPQVVPRILHTLKRTTRFIKENPDETKAMLKKLYNMEDQTIQEIMDEKFYEVSLRQSLFLALESEARWRISSGLTNGKKTPDFLKIIDEEPLKLILPQNVTIVR